jgi:GTP:adenosylcobinamide-phosphate guanylyltransferase
MDSIVVAGGRPGPEDPLYPYTQGLPKALVPVGDRPMLAHILNALQEAEGVGRIVVVGLEQDEGESVIPYLATASGIVFLPDHGSIVGNGRAGLEWLVRSKPEATEVLIATSDIPLLTAAVVDAFLVDCQPFDHLAYYNVVTRQTFESRFPRSNRTFVRLQDAEIAGGDLFLAQTRILHTNQELWEALTNARKHAWRLARLVGPLTVLKLLLRRLSLGEVEHLASRMFAGPIRILVSPYPELAMDVDKPYQVELVRSQFTAASVG